jgi:hypothetical protein
MEIQKKKMSENKEISLITNLTKENEELKKINEELKINLEECRKKFIKLEFDIKILRDTIKDKDESIEEMTILLDKGEKEKDKNDKDVVEINSNKLILDSQATEKGKEKLDDILNGVKGLLEKSLYPIKQRLSTLERICIETTEWEEESSDEEDKGRRGRGKPDDGEDKKSWRKELQARLRERRAKKKKPLTHTDIEIETLKQIELNLYDVGDMGEARKMVKERKKYLKIAQDEGPKVAAKVIGIEVKKWDEETEKKIKEARQEIIEEQGWKAAKEFNGRRTRYKPRNRVRIRCWNCKRYGHTSPYCWLRKERRYNERSEGSTGTSTING